MASHGMDARKERILWAIIEDYIQTAMPVGSRTISRKYETSLSSATIRNEMSDLEELGYLAQPHVSAGRVPSVKAYRLYVDELLGGTLPQNPQARAFFSQRVRQMEDVITSAAQAISEFTHYTAVVMMPKQLELRVSTLQLVPMPRGAALLVIVTDTGAIRDTVIHVSESLDGDALYAMEKNESLAYVIPDEGSNVWVDGMCIPKTTQNKAAAECFINFMCRPDIAQMNMDYIYYSSPIKQVVENLSEEELASTAMNPTDDMLARCAYYVDISSFENANLYDDIWMDVLM